ncbi:MAG: hypothetical protein ABJN69_06910 [Hellea sp.]
MWITRAAPAIDYQSNAAKRRNRWRFRVVLKVKYIHVIYLNFSLRILRTDKAPAIDYQSNAAKRRNRWRFRVGLKGTIWNFNLLDYFHHPRLRGDDGIGVLLS